MKYLKRLRKFLMMFIPAMVLFVGVAQAEEDWCTNLDGVQATPPAGYHVETDYTCTVLQTPVTIDLVPPGGEPITIDVNPPDAQGNYWPAVTIDVNPVGLEIKTFTEANATTSVSTTTPTVITSVEQLQAYIFDPDTTKEQRVESIENHIKSLLQKIIEILTAQIEAALKAASSTP